MRSYYVAHGTSHLNMMEDNVRKRIYIHTHTHMTGSLCCTAETDRTFFIIEKIKILKNKTNNNKKPKPSATAFKLKAP